MNRGRFAAVPLRLSSSFSDKSVVALIKHEDTLVIGLDPPEIMSVPLRITEDGPVEVGARKSTLVTVQGNMYIKTLRSCGGTLLVHLAHANGFGQLLAMSNSFQSITCVQKDVTAFCVGMFSHVSAVASASEGSVAVKELRGGKWVGVFAMGFSERVIDLAMSMPYIYVVTGSSISVIHTTTKAGPALRTPGNALSCVMSVSYDRFFSYSGMSAMVLDGNLSVGDFLPVMVGSSATDHCKFGSLYASVLDNEVVIYRFTNTMNPLMCSKVKGARKVAEYQGNLLVATATDVFLVSDMTAVMETFLSGSDELMRSTRITTLLAIFDQFWMSGERESAIHMLSLPNFRTSWPDVAALFPFLQVHEERHALMAEAAAVYDEGACRAFADVLMTTEDSNNSVVATIVVELLAKLGANEELEAYITRETRPNIEMDNLRDFLQCETPDMFVYYLRAIGHFDEAIDTFKEAGNLPEVLRTITLNVKSFDFVADNVSWLFERDPILAFSVFKNRTVSRSKSVKFAKERYPKFYLGIVGAILQQKRVDYNRDMLNSYCHDLFGCLANVADPSFSRDHVAFCRCVIKNANAPTADIELEITHILEEVICTCRAELSDATIQMIDGVASDELRSKLLRASGESGRALQLLWEVHHDFGECESICVDHPELLSPLMKMAKANLSPTESDKCITGLIERNIGVIDASAAMSLLSQDIALGDLSGFLEACFLSLNSKRIGAELEAAFAKSESFEAEYQATRSKMGVVQARKHTCCSICGRPLGFSSVHRTIHGDICHEKCLQRYD